MAQPFHDQGFIIMIEQDKAEKDYTAYIPALRLGAKGDTIEEVRENARDLIAMEIESMLKRGKAIPDDNCIVETLTVSITV
ncbi:type II toxin-antitoxin system HicB family antitoxin [Paenibacillus sp. p3-SID867]|uniref:type II toxin-antitoxin system HicB family antitoxin n=1 Tax=Paenibacillus sp. p3-SID867 TaxID=2916363 RepID=UPI0021A37D13|nr:type II toxin-antitoxin system HicB family antitoxin [Paenibacillus sp. p3-SID867]MCT1403853.1 type II toxin-antitoxin system HicB family antitoxin [Paenibacillus sp. p3-SID867]